jgi:hypothetical protein
MMQNAAKIELQEFSCDVRVDNQAPLMSPTV